MKKSWQSTGLAEALRLYEAAKAKYKKNRLRMPNRAVILDCAKRGGCDPASVYRALRMGKK